jgi:hypothetical protein
VATDAEGCVNASEAFARAGGAGQEIKYVDGVVGRHTIAVVVQGPWRGAGLAATDLCLADSQRLPNERSARGDGVGNEVYRLACQAPGDPAAVWPANQNWPTRLIDLQPGRRQQPSQRAVNALWCCAARTGASFSSHLIVRPLRHTALSQCRASGQPGWAPLRDGPRGLTA